MKAAIGAIGAVDIMMFGCDLYFVE